MHRGFLGCSLAHTPRFRFFRAFSDIQRPKIAIVTGASRGIGKNIAEKLATQLYSVAVISRGPESLSTAQSLPKLNSGQAHRGYQCDVGNPDQVQQITDAIIADLGTTHKDLITTYRQGNPYLLVNCAGITKDGLLARLNDESLKEVISTNLLGSIYMARAVSKPMLREKEGVIINIGSVIGSNGRTGQTSYSASKAGLIGVTKSWAKELGPKGIRVNLIEPGFIETDMTEGISEPIRKNILSKILLGRFGQAEEISDTVLFLIGNRYITGQIITVDGEPGDQIFRTSHLPVPVIK